MARQALPPLPDNTYSTPSSAVLKQDGTKGPQRKKKPPAGPDCQHISERFVEEAIHKKSLRKPCIVEALREDHRHHPVHAVLGSREKRHP